MQLSQPSASFRASTKVLNTSDPLDVLAVRCLRSFKAFVKTFWRVLEPATPLVWNWHQDLICEHLEAVTRNEIRLLVIEVPPGHMKSLLVSVLWPCWEWLFKASERTLFASGDGDNVTRDAVKSRRVLKSSLYRRILTRLYEMGLVDSLWEFAADQNAKQRYENTATGTRVGVTVASKVTGKRGDKIVIDDPVDARDATRWSPAQCAERMSKVETWYNEALSTRFNSLESARIVLIMQRLHESDLAGIARADPDATILSLPTHYDPKTAHPQDPRTVAGELLFPARFPDVEIKKLQRKLGKQFAAQHNQKPIPDKGETFELSWMQKRYAKSDLPVLASRFAFLCVSVDCALKNLNTSDMTAIHVWGVLHTGQYILLDRIADQMIVPDIVGNVHALRAMWSRNFKGWGAEVPWFVLVEDAANGPEVIRQFRKRLGGVHAFSASKYGSKVARARMASLFFESGSVWLPDAEECDWIHEVVRYWVKFGAARYDDDVDAMSQFIIWASRRLGAGASALMGDEYLDERIAQDLESQREEILKREGVGAARAFDRASSARLSEVDEPVLSDAEYTDLEAAEYGGDIDDVGEAERLLGSGSEGDGFDWDAFFASQAWQEAQGDEDEPEREPEPAKATPSGLLEEVVGVEEKERLDGRGLTQDPVSAQLWDGLRQEGVVPLRGEEVYASDVRAEVRRESLDDVVF